jgi:hypothetical protein
MKYGYYLSQYMRWHYFDAAGGGALDLHAHLATWLPTAVSGGVLLTAGPGLFSYMATAGDNSFVQFTSTVGKTYIARCTPSSGARASVQSAAPLQLLLPCVLRTFLSALINPLHPSADAIACELAGEIAAASAVGVPPWDSTWGTVYGTNKYGFSYSLTEAKPSGKALFFQTVTRVSAAWTGISVGLTGTTFDEMNSKSVRTAYPQNSRMGLHTTRIDAVTGKVDIPTNGDTHYVDGVVNLPATEAGIWNTALYHYSIYNLLSPSENTTLLGVSPVDAYFTADSKKALLQVLKIDWAAATPAFSVLADLRAGDAANYVWRTASPGADGASAYLRGEDAAGAAVYGRATAAGLVIRTAQFPAAPYAVADAVARR